MQKKSLQEALERYCREAAAVITAVQPPPMTIQSKYEIFEKETSHTYVPRIEWFVVVIKLESKIKALESYHAAAEALHADSRIARHLGQLVGTSESRMRVDAESLLRAVLLRAIEDETGRFNPERFARVCDELEDFLYKDSLGFRFLAPLNGFKMASDRLELEGAAIIRIPKEEREGILSEGSVFGQSLMFGGVPEFGLESRVSTPKVIGEEGGGRPGPTNIVQERFSDIVTALRLYRAGFVGFDQVRARGDGAAFGGGTMTIGVPGQHFVHEGYSLSKDEEKDFASFWGRYKAAANRTHPGIAMALRRLNFGYERRRPEDKLVDYCIAFEALLLREKAELEHRLALRVSRLLVGGTADERENFYLQIRAAYGVRSDIVHGEAVKDAIKVGPSSAPQRVPFNDFVRSVEELLRVSIRKVLADYSAVAQKEMLKSLDRLIARGE